MDLILAHPGHGGEAFTWFVIGGLALLFFLAFRSGPREKRPDKVDAGQGQEEDPQ